jgi:hypothetical protein
MSEPTKGPADFYSPGDYNVVCFQCGRKKKASWMKKHWEGYWVCPEHWEPRQPQDFARGVPDTQAPAWTQPMPENVFVFLCSPNTMTAYPGYAEPGCALPGYVSPQFDPNITDI